VLLPSSGHTSPILSPLSTRHASSTDTYFVFPFSFSSVTDTFGFSLLHGTCHPDFLRLFFYIFIAYRNTRTRCIRHSLFPPPSVNHILSPKHFYYQGNHPLR
jgi:hypothetical protein